MTRRGMLLAAFIAISIPFSGSYSQTVDPNRNYWGDVDRFLNRQYEVTLNLVADALTRFPPQLPEPFIRRMAMLMLDGVLHEESAPELLPVQDFFHSAMGFAVDEIESTRVSRGAIIWKLYDHGFVVRTPTVTIGFDLVRGYSAGVDSFAVPDRLMERIIEQCDLLFISHWHGDHADRMVISSFIGADKPVVAPAEAEADSAFQGRITHLAADADSVQVLPIQGGSLSLEVVVFPGHQGADMSNNVTLVRSPEGLAFCHTGDQSNEDDFSWIDEVSDQYEVDVLMINCWTTDISRAARGFDPELIITGHENELGHSIDHREPFWLTYDRLSRTSYPFLVMTWGESYHYLPR